MLLWPLIFGALNFILAAIGMHTPWFVAVTSASTAKTMKVGFLLADLADEAYQPVFPGGYCPSTLTTHADTCTSYAILSFALYLVYGVGLILVAIGTVFSLLHVPSGLIMFGLSLTFQSAACFGFFFRVLGLQISVAGELNGAVTAWSLDWAGIICLIGVFFCFWAVVSFALTYCPKPPPEEEKPKDDAAAAAAAQQQGGAAPAAGSSSNEPIAAGSNSPISGGAGGGGQQQQQQQQPQALTQPQASSAYHQPQQQPQYGNTPQQQQQQQAPPPPPPPPMQY